MLDFIVQFMGAIPLLIGLWLMGDKRRTGVLLAFMAEGFTTAVGIMHHVWSIILIGGVLFVVQGRNFLKWHRERIPW